MSGLPNTRDLTFLPGISPVASGTLNNMQDCIVSIVANQSDGTFGPGTDGAVTLDGAVAAPSWCTKSGTVYTMTRDAFPNSLTLTGAGVELKTAGFRLRVKNQFQTIGGAFLDNNGEDAATFHGGHSAASGTVNGGSANAPDGGTGAGSNGTNATNSFGGAGGNGGNGASGVGGTGGTATVPAATAGRPEAHPGPLLGAIAAASGITWLVGGAPGGSGGGGGGGNDGGGGGGPAGVLCLAARRIVLASANDVRCRGGAGGPGLGATIGGGGGGGGGVAIIAYQSLSVASGTLNSATVCAGGAAGVGSGALSLSTAGSTGTLFTLDVSVAYNPVLTGPASPPSALPAAYIEPLPNPGNFAVNSVIVNKTTNQIMITYDQVNWTALS